MSGNEEKNGVEPERRKKASFPTLSLPGAGELNDSSERLLGSQIGAYKLKSILGKGGFGVVYLAEQKEPIQRQVALKVIKPGMDTQKVIGRFEQERQALAWLDHPNIAHIYEGGTTEAGYPYFVMEYVKGAPITKFCDEQRLSIEERLELFEQVCRAVQHAHQKGIIHRDIKPSNVLVSVKDDKPVPKVIDFGVAKAISQPLTDRTLFTEQDQFIGTPEYMSPEQAALTGQDIDTRSDIYSLGVLLYELLTGMLPFAPKILRQAAFDELRQIIREEDPQRPSTRISSLGNDAEEVAEKRRISVVALTRRLHKELEWIPLKAMRKEPDRRYKTASEVADDVQNYLEGDPLIAGPESVAYRARKFMRKRRGLVAAVSAVAMAMLIGLIISTVLYFRSEKSKKDTERQLYLTNVVRANEELRNNRMERACELLDKCPENLRNWEWGHLNWLTLQRDREVGVLQGHDDYITSVAFSPDGKCIASCGLDARVKVWDVEQKTIIQTIYNYCERVYSLAFSPDGKSIAFGSGENIIVWDIENERRIKTFHCGGRWVVSVAFSPDGKYIAAASATGPTKVWDVKVGSNMFNGYPDSASVAFNLDGSCIAVGSREGVITLWDLKEGSEIRAFSGHQAMTFSIAFSPDGKHFASGSLDKTVRLWDIEEGKVRTFEGHNAPVLCVDFRSDGEYIASSSIDGCIKIWRIDVVEELLSLQVSSKHHYLPVQIIPWNTSSSPFGEHEVYGCLDFSPNGEVLVTSGDDNTIRLWDIESIPPTFILQGHEEKRSPSAEKVRPVNSVAFSKDGKHIISGHSDDMVRVWDAGNGQEVLNLGGYIGEITSVATDGDIIVFGGSKGIIQIWNVRDKKLVRTLAPRRSITGIGINVSKRLIMSSSEDGIIRVWNIESNEEPLKLIGHKGAVFSVCFNSQGDRIISGGADKALRVWNSETGNEVLCLNHRVEVKNVAIALDGSYMASASSDGIVKVWKSQNGELVSTLVGPKSTVIPLTFNTDGTRLFSGMKHTLIIWNPITEQKVIEVKTPCQGDYTLKRYIRSRTDPATGQTVPADVIRLGREDTVQYYPEICSLALSPDGKTIAAGLSNGRLKIWFSDEPGEGSHRWRETEIAQRLLHQLFHLPQVSREETLHGFKSYFHVVNRFENSDTLSKFPLSIRKIARKIAEIRRADPCFALEWAVRRGDKERAELLIAEGANVNGENTFGDPLIWAVITGRKDIVDFLITNAANVYAGSENKALSCAEKYGHKEIAEVIRRQSEAVNDILKAVQQGDLAKVKAILASKPELLCAACDRQENTLLHLAALNGQKDIAEFLIAQGAEIESTNGYMFNYVPLHLAVQSEHEDLVALLIAAGADVNAGWGRTDSPLHLAVESGNIKIVRFLISKGADVNIKRPNLVGVTEGERPLSIAAVAGYHEIAQNLIVNGAEVNSENFMGYTALHYAAKEGQEKVTEVLISNRAHVDAEDKYRRTPLHMAAEKGRKQTAEILIANGAEIEARASSDELTPLHMAAMEGHKELVQLLINCGANVNAIATRVSGCDRVTPLDLAKTNEVAELLRAAGAKINVQKTWTPEIIFAVQENNLDLVKSLLKQNPKLANIKDRDGYAPMYHAIVKNHTQIAELFLRHGGNLGVEVFDAATQGDLGKMKSLLANDPELVKAKDPVRQWTPLFWAVEKGHKEVIDFLIASGADVDARDKYAGSPLYRAAAYGDEKVVESLLANGADANAVDIYGRTALHGAASAGRKDIVEFLIANHANVNAKDNSGHTPLYWAFHNKHIEVVDLLRQYDGYGAFR